MGTEHLRQYEEEYRLLTSRLTSGAISRAEFEQGVARLAIQDALGRRWQIDPATGKWFLAEPRQEAIHTEPQVRNQPVAESAPETLASHSRFNWIRAVAIVLIVAFAIFDMFGLALLTRVGPFAIQASPPVRSASGPQLPLGPTPSSTATPVPPTNTLAPPAAAPRLPSQAPGIPTAAPLVSATDAAPATAVLKQLYVISMRTDPTTPKRQQNITFVPTVVNTTGTTISGRWLIYLFHPENLNQPFGQTSSDRITEVPPGTVEVPANGSWKLMSPGGCEAVIVRAAWLNGNGQGTFLTRPDGQVFQLTYDICP